MYFVPKELLPITDNLIYFQPELILILYHTHSTTMEPRYAGNPTIFSAFIIAAMASEPFSFLYSIWYNFTLTSFSIMILLHVNWCLIQIHLHVNSI